MFGSQWHLLFIMAVAFWLIVRKLKRFKFGTLPAKLQKHQSLAQKPKF
jgi:hypothetical protein